MLTPFPATGVEGIFRLSGSEKRIKELKSIFNSPDRYGKGLVWDGYTVHDAANVFRRYLNDLPEPVVPLDLYEKFREPLRGATKQALGDAEGPQFVENFDQKAAIASYQKLITGLPPLNKQLLLYILDLLAVFAAKSDENRMTSQNLAAIFQPGMLSHPNHAMAPEEYRLNQCVIIFLIENQDHFLIGMQGTAADELTRQEVESGATPLATPVTPTSNRRSGVGIGRSASNASAGAQSVLRDGQIRRNRSVNSRHSKRDGDTTPNSPALSTVQTGGGLGRSNTVPSKKSPAISGGKFRKQAGDASGTHSPVHLEPLTPAHPPGHTPGTPRMSEHAIMTHPVGGANVSPGPGPSQERLLGVPQGQTTPSKERNLQSLFQRSPTDESKRQPNKLRKKKIPGSMNHSAQSSNTSLPPPTSAISPNGEPVNPLDHTPIEQPEMEQSQSQAPIPQQSGEVSSEPSQQANPAPQTGNPLADTPAKAETSPPTSLHSYNESSDAGHGAEPQHASSNDQPDKEKKSMWRMSRAKKDDKSIPRASSSERNYRTSEAADASQTSFGSGGNSSQKQRKSFTGETGDTSITTIITTSDTHHSRDESFKEGKDDGKGPMSWIRNKYREAKETAEQRRNKSPPSDPGSSLVTRGKSLDIKRDHAPPAEKTDTPVQEKQPAAQEPTVPTVHEDPQETPAGATSTKSSSTSAAAVEPAGQGPTVREPTGQEPTISTVAKDPQEAPTVPVITEPATTDVPPPMEPTAHEPTVPTVPEDPQETPANLTVAEPQKQ